MNSVGRVALVTGAGRGIGRAVAEELAARGVAVAVTATRRAAADAVADAIRENGGVAEGLALHFPDPDGVAAIRDAVLERFGRLDILVNNAGVYLDDPRSAGNPPLIDLDPDHLMATLAVNLDGPFRLIAAFLPSMLARNFGRIVNVSSGLGRFDDLDARGPFYRLSKLVLNGLTRIVAREVAGANVLVNAVCPGWTRTDMGGPAAPRSPDEGAGGIVWAALLPDGGPSGGFFRDGQRLDWCHR